MSAVFSPCGLYRYRLDRVIDMLGGPIIGFCLHNPSTADAEHDDPTSRRGIGFVRTWGGSRLIFVNAFAGCATKPVDLWGMVDPIGPERDTYIVAAARECMRSGGFMVAAWGAVNPPAKRRDGVLFQLSMVERIIRSTGCEIRALGVTADGSPRHPLYVRADAVPRPWPSAFSDSASLTEDSRP